MKRINLFLVSMFVFVSPAVAATTPEGLVQELTQAAHNGDVEGFHAAMSAKTRRALADAEAAASKLTLAQKDLSGALDERFGVAQTRGSARHPIADPKTVLSRLVDIALTGMEQKTPNEARLRLKTVSKTSGDRITTEEDTFSAVEENGEWKLDLTDLNQWINGTAEQRAAAYEHVAQEVRSGAFKDRFSAFVALAKAERSYSAGGANK